MPAADLLEVYDTERHLLGIACSRARNNFAASAQPASEFLDDLKSRKLAVAHFCGEN